MNSFIVSVLFLWAPATAFVLCPAPFVVTRSCMASNDDNNNASPAPSETTESAYGSLLKKTLDDVDPFGTFASFGDKPGVFQNPIVNVKGYGEVSLPLKPESAEILKGLASKSPFGRGPDTLYDDDIRTSWQFEPDSVQVFGTEWDDMLNEMLLDAAYGLGFSNESVEKMGIKPNLYKVLLYEEGGHFKPHRDTEKEEGMFASLVVQLPSSFKGGDIRVSHQGKTMTFESSVGCNQLLKYSAFYSDCMHELLPVTEGWRMCLVYNVVCSSPEEAPDLKAFARENTAQEMLRRVCKEWRESESPPGVLGYSLDHSYTLQRCKLDDLKGRDRVVATVLRDATGEDGSPLFDVRIVVFYLQIVDTNCPQTNAGVEVVIDLDGEEVSETALKRQKKLMYVGGDGLFRTFEDLSDDHQNKIQNEERWLWFYHPEEVGYEGSEVLYSVFRRGWEEADVIEYEHTGNEGGGRITWYRSAALVFKPHKFGNVKW